MKRTLLIIFASITMIMLASCSNTDSENNMPPDTVYDFLSADWAYYDNSQELLENSNLVYIGKITGISFEFLDNSALPVTEKQEVQLHWFHTIYDVEVIELYKGDTSKNTKFRVMGGIKGFREEEQRSLLDKYNVINRERGLPVWDSLVENYTGYQIGETYLFVLYQFETGIPTTLNFDQTSYDIGNPFEEYYNGITVKKIISSLGKDKWDSFLTQWQKDNPDWEAWLDRDMVE